MISDLRIELPRDLAAELEAEGLAVRQSIASGALHSVSSLLLEGASVATTVVTVATTAASIRRVASGLLRRARSRPGGRPSHIIVRTGGRSARVTIGVDMTADELAEQLIGVLAPANSPRPTT